MSFLFPEDEIGDGPGGMADVSNERKKKATRQFVQRTPEENIAYVDEQIRLGRYDPQRSDVHRCTSCGASMAAIHYLGRQSEGEYCQPCSALKAGCDCPACERMRIEKKEAERARDEME